jgi:hypothetical protein
VLDLERSIVGGNWSSGNRFKFIERTAGIEDHRGIRVDDGIVRVEHEAEQIVINDVVHHSYRQYDYWPPVWPHQPCTPRIDSLVARLMYAADSVTASSFSANANDLVKSETNVNSQNSASVNDVGITVPGSVSHQRFVAVAPFKGTGQSEVLILRLRGEVSGKKIAAPVTVDQRVTCVTCGKQSRSGVAFCATCGTALNVI